MRLLIIEDESDFREKVRSAIRHANAPIDYLTPQDVALEKPFDVGTSYEEQLLERLKRVQGEKSVDLVLLDSDLSRMGNGITQSMCRQAFQELGVPVCRYKKKQTDTATNRLQDLKRVAREGASAVWVPPNHAKVDHLPALIHWLLAVGEGFGRLRDILVEQPDLLKMPLGPAGVLARILERPSVKASFLGYTAQNFFFFGAPLDEDGPLADQPTSGAVQATRLGYWLLNYILLFPGPILSSKAAAAYLNLTADAFSLGAVQALVRKAEYFGPFSGLGPYYWRDDLSSLLDATDGDVATHETLKEATLERVDQEFPTTSAYFCVLTQEPIAELGAALNPDWIPAGASVARIRQDLFDKIDPMLST